MERSALILRDSTMILICIIPRSLPMILILSVPGVLISTSERITCYTKLESAPVKTRLTYI
jgi:hypothetical protein